MKLTVISIVLSILFTATLGATGLSEPNDAGSETKFEFNNKTKCKWRVSLGKNKEGLQVYVDNPSPNKPTHAAKVLLHENYTIPKSKYVVLDRIYDSPIAKKFSKSQKEFLKTEYTVLVVSDSIRTKPYHYHSTWLYAVSEEDAKLMAQAYLDGLNKYAGWIMVDQKRVLNEWQEKLHLAQKELPEKEAKLKDLEEQYKREKNKTHRFSSEEETPKLAKENILEMNKTLDTLEIELSGIREKLKAIEKYRNEPEQREAIRARLDEMFVEQMIELSGLEARRQTTERLRAEQQLFLILFNKRNDLQHEVGKLRKTIESSKNAINDINDLLKNPMPHMLPPKVYQNKVVIYPVLTE
jgi:hypothetical protein